MARSCGISISACPIATFFVQQHVREQILFFASRPCLAQHSMASSKHCSLMLRACLPNATQVPHNSGKLVDEWIGRVEIVAMRERWGCDRGDSGLGRGGVERTGRLGYSGRYMNQMPPGQRAAWMPWMARASVCSCLSSRSCPARNTSMAPPATSDSACRATVKICAPGGTHQHFWMCLPGLHEDLRTRAASVGWEGWLKHLAAEEASRAQLEDNVHNLVQGRRHPGAVLPLCRRRRRTHILNPPHTNCSNY